MNKKLNLQVIKVFKLARDMEETRLFISNEVLKKRFLILDPLDEGSFGQVFDC